MQCITRWMYVCMYVCVYVSVENNAHCAMHYSLESSSLAVFELELSRSLLPTEVTCMYVCMYVRKKKVRMNIFIFNLHLCMYV